MSIYQKIPGSNSPIRLITVLDKMIITELVKTICAILLVLVIIIVSQKFIKMLAQAIEGNIANETVFILLGLKTIIVTNSFLPAAIFMSVLVVLGRMHQEQEISAINSAGGGIFSLYRGIFILLIPICAISFALSIIVAPWAEAKTQQLTSQDRQNSDIRSISAGRFTEYSNGELVFYAEKVDNNGLMQNVFMQNKDRNKTGVINANIGHLENIDGALYLVLEKGERTLGIVGEKEFTLETFDKYAIQIEKHPISFNLNSQAIPSQVLVISNEARDIAELQNRINTTVGLILLAFIATPLAKLSPRGGIYGSLLIAFGIYFTYGNLQKLSYSWVTNGQIPTWFGYFWLNCLLFVIGMILLLHSYGWRWLWQCTFRSKTK